MKFQKYYDDIKNFPNQFAKGIEIAKQIVLPKEFLAGSFDNVVLCGVGGSSLPGDLINNILSASNNPTKTLLHMSRSYDIPSWSTTRTFFIVCSYSGNTEETLNAYEQVMKKGFRHVVLASGGKLLDLANANNSPVFNIPTGLQPRLSTGYIIAGIFYFLEMIGIISNISSNLVKASEQFSGLVDEQKCVLIAKRIKGKVPIIYAEEENFSVARIGKIKMNENAKTQAFWNFFPELNHNEMVGFTNMVMNPFFLIFSSSYSNKRNQKRIEVFCEMMHQKKLDFEVIRFASSNLIEELLAGYYFMDLVSYHLACEYDIDPEPVNMVEDFKKRMEEI